MKYVGGALKEYMKNTRKRDGEGKIGVEGLQQFK